MLGLFRKPRVSELSESVRLALREQQPRGMGPTAGLRMVQMQGLCEGRKVVYFKVFDQASMTGKAQGFADLAPEAVLYSGHVEREGRVILNG